MNKRLEQLIKKREELNARIQKVKAVEAAAERKRDTRRKILLGALMMEMMERGELDKGAIDKRLDGFLVREGDRLLFDLPVKEGEKVKNPSPSEVSEGSRDSGAFEVVLLEVPADVKIATLRVVREITGLDLKGAKEVVEAQSPPVLITVNGRSEAERLKGLLAEVGSKAIVRARSGDNGAGKTGGK